MFRLMAQAILSTAGLALASMAAGRDVVFPASLMVGALLAMTAAAVLIWFAPRLWCWLMTHRPAAGGAP